MSWNDRRIRFAVWLWESKGSRVPKPLVILKSTRKSIAPPRPFFLSFFLSFPSFQLAEAPTFWLGGPTSVLLFVFCAVDMGRCRVVRTGTIRARSVRDVDVVRGFVWPAGATAPGQ